MTTAEIQAASLAAGLRPILSESANDCFSAAVASMLGLDLADVPEGPTLPPAHERTTWPPPVLPGDETEYWRRWIAWAADRGLGIYVHRHPPAHRPLWVACVADHPENPATHAVVMHRDTIAWDPGRFDVDNGGEVAGYPERWHFRAGLTFDETHSDGESIESALSRLGVPLGIQSRYFDKADPANKKLFLQAEDLTPLSTSTDTAGAAGASGTNVIRNTDLTTSYQAVLSTEIDATNTHLGHVGTHRVWARLYRPSSNTGAVDVALEWAEGDFRRFTQNEAVSFEANEREGVFTLADLGLVHLTQVAQGLQRWEGRIIARSTVIGDELDVDCLFLFPVDEGYGEVRANPAVSTPTSFSGRTSFTTEAGALSGDSADVGGVWTTEGSTTDFNVASGVATRSTFNDTDPGANQLTGRVAYLGGLSAMTAQAIQVDIRSNGWSLDNCLGIVARRNIADQRFEAFITDTGSGPIFKWRAYVNEVETGSGQSPLGTLLENGAWYTLRLAVFTSGALRAWFGRAGGQLVAVHNAQVPDLATGGALAAGSPGIFDLSGNVLADTRDYDNFAVWVPADDAAIFASQSLEIRHDGVIREDSGGAIWTPVSDYKGDYLLIPPAGKEERETRIIIMASRNLPESGADSGIDDISARLTYTPRYLQLPEG